MGPHCLKTWSVTQGAPALSSCEAEYYAVVGGATRALGVQAAAKELGVSAADQVIGVTAGDQVIELSTDSSGAKSLASRRGSRRIRHIETKWLWLQHVVAIGLIQMRKVDSVTNFADVFTKYLGLSDAKSKMSAVNVEIVGKDSGVGAGSCGDRTSELGRRGPPRLAWADACDSECEAELAVGACAFCGVWANECWERSSEGACRDRGPTHTAASRMSRMHAAILA